MKVAEDRPLARALRERVVSRNTEIHNHQHPSPPASLVEAARAPLVAPEAHGGKRPASDRVGVELPTSLADGSPGWCSTAFPAGEDQCAALISTETSPEV
jgi:hypothetical protein